ncbi:MAG TPA: aerotolerance regulator BatA [Cyanobacteria bacterium UBA8530]|nr:aerotolerance regulator BatA [Cyanobacteria bacterium UBA8530]
MTFETPLFLLLFLLLPWVLKPALSSRKGLPLNTLAFLAENEGFLARHSSTLSRALAASFLILALAGPQSPGRWIEEKMLGIDMMLAIDLSGSMRAEDFQPQNRLEAAKKVLHEFIVRNEGHRIGLVAFAGKSLTVSPLTTDLPMLLEALDNLSFGSIKEDGTAIGDAIANSLYRLEEKGAKSRVIVLLTDGQNNAGMIQPEAAAQIAQSRSIKIYTVAVGRPGGAPVPINNSFGLKSYLRTPDGQLYLTKVDEEGLKRLSSIANGAFFRATDTRGLEQAYRRISRMERSVISASRHRVKEDLSFFPLLLALLALAATWALSLGRLEVLQVNRIKEEKNV